MENSLSIWISGGSFVLAFAAFLAVIWQIMREYASRPIDGMYVGKNEILEAEQYTDYFVNVGIMGPKNAHEVQFVVWGGSVIGPWPEIRRSMTADSEPMAAIVRVHHGERVQVGLSYLDSGLLLARGVGRASRRDLERGPESYEVWQWSLWQGLPRRGAKAERGKWRTVDEHYIPSKMSFPAKERPYARHLPIPDDYASNIPGFQDFLDEEEVNDA